MSVATNIIKGVVKRFRTKAPSGRFKRLSWSDVKLLKHQDNVAIKRWKVADKILLYKRPYEFMHTYEEPFESEIYRFESLSSKPSIIDCGANIGMSVIYFKAIFPSASIVAFEPDEDNFKVLEQNVADNNLTDVRIVKAAVWKEPGTLHFASSGTQGSKLANSNEETGIIKVKAERLRDWLLQPVDFLKIDIEGAEDVVLEDCADHLHNVVNMFVEYHGKTSDTHKLTRMLTIVEQAGFKTYVKMAADNLQHPFKLKESGHSFDVQLNLFCYR